jgi:hypothetical protein
MGRTRLSSVKGSRSDRIAPRKRSNSGSYTANDSNPSAKRSRTLPPSAARKRQRVSEKPVIVSKGVKATKSSPRSDRPAKRVRASSVSRKASASDKGSSTSASASAASFSIPNASISSTRATLDSIRTQSQPSSPVSSRQINPDKPAPPAVSPKPSSSRSDHQSASTSAALLSTSLKTAPIGQRYRALVQARMLKRNEVTQQQGRREARLQKEQLRNLVEAKRKRASAGRPASSLRRSLVPGSLRWIEDIFGVPKSSAHRWTQLKVSATLESEHFLAIVPVGYVNYLTLSCFVSVILAVRLRRC